MDTLSRLLSLYPMQGSIDVRCHFGAPWLIDHQAVAPHIAPYHLVLEGAAWLEMPDSPPLPMQAGDIVLFPHGRAHRMYLGELDAASPIRILSEAGALLQQQVNEGNGPLTEVLCGEFRSAPDVPNAMLVAMPDTVIIRAGDDQDAADLEGLQSLIGLLRRETQANRAGAEVVIAQLASVLFALMIRAWLAQAPMVSGLYALLAERRLQPALHGMLSDPGQDWTLETMAQACNMSRATLARLFQQISDITPAALLMQTRMAHAGLMLKRGNLSVGAVGEAVGYQSEAAFNRAFKRHFGVGPGTYRRRGE